MAKKFAVLQQIEQDHSITDASGRLFLQALHHGLLLALWEKGYLREPELRLAEEKLDLQCGSGL